MKEDASVLSGMSMVGLSSNITNSPWWSCVGSSSAAGLLGKDLADVVRPEFTETVRAVLQRHKKTPDTLSLPQKKTQGVLASPDEHNSDQVLTCSLAPGNTGVYLLEVELIRGIRHQVGREMPATDRGLLHVANMMGSIPVGSTPRLCTTVLCDALLEAMPAYDRITVYRFAADASGEVIHESSTGIHNSSSFLGLRFPAGDIPPVAHERNGVRFIADTSAQIVPVVSTYEESAQLDISMTALTAPVESHRRYLQNTGVTVLYEIRESKTSLRRSAGPFLVSSTSTASSCGSPGHPSLSSATARPPSARKSARASWPMATVTNPSPSDQWGPRVWPSSRCALSSWPFCAR